MDKEQRQQKRIPEPKVKTNICSKMGCTNLGSEYAENSTLHGLRYVGDSELHLIERFYWIVAVVFGVLGATYFISSLYARWRDSPMIVSLSPTPTSLNDIPFPAITICNMNRALKSVAGPIKLSLNEEANEDIQFKKDVLNDFCGPIFKGDTDNRVAANWSTFKDFLVELSQPCQRMLVACKWSSSELGSCSDYFNADLTGEGMCCSFNKIDKNFIYRNPEQPLGLVDYDYTHPDNGIDWTPEKGYPPGTPADTNPWRARGPGASMGLTLILDAELEEYFCSDTASVGFKVMLHNPLESVHRISDIAHFISAGTETRVEIKPEITTANTNLHNVPLEKRQCYFSSERELQFFNTYTQRNCELECHSNLTLFECKCVPFYLPRAENTRICGTLDEDCVAYVKVLMGDMLTVIDENNTQTALKMECPCLPGCVTIDYAKEMSSSRLHSFSVASVAEYNVDRQPDYYKENMAVVQFYFAQKSFTGIEQGEIFGFTEFLSNTGGLLGLFLGFSIMSIIELIYFLSLRLIFSWFRSKNDIIQPVFKKSDNRFFQSAQGHPHKTPIRTIYNYLE